MQFRRAANHAALEISDDNGAVLGAFPGVAFDETVIQEAIEAVMTALGVEPLQVIAQQRQLFLVAQRPDGALERRRTSDVLVVH